MRRSIAAVVLAAGLLAASCGGGEGDVADDIDEQAVADDAGPASDGADDAADAADGGSDGALDGDVASGPRAPLTGLPAGEDLLGAPIVVVKISNNDDRSLAALVGLEHADIVVEERIEDRATRFAALFHSDLPGLVGPVRSARTTDIELMRNLGDPVLVFSGANISVLGELRDLANAGGVVLVLDDESGRYLQRDTDFSAPDNLFADVALVGTDFADAAGAAHPIVDFRTSDTESRPASIDGTAVTVEGRDTVSFVYDPERGYVRLQDGVVHVTREGMPLIVDNVVVMEVGYRANANDAESVDAVTVGDGPASVMIEGRRFEGRWYRETGADPYRFETTAGDQILLEPGRSWITLVPTGTYEFDADAESRRLVTGDAE